MKFNNFLFILLVIFTVVHIALGRINENAPGREKTHKIKRQAGPNLLVSLPTGTVLNRSGWTVTASSTQPGNEAQRILDGDTRTFWHSKYSDSPPHTITVDMKQSHNVAGLTILPRQDGNPNGHIGRHFIFLSSDGSNFGSPVAYGTFMDDNNLKAVSFEPRPARYIRIQALTEAGNRGLWISMAELTVYRANSYTPPRPGRGVWGPTINLPLVPVTAAVQPVTGRVLAWAAFAPDTFSGGPGGRTVTATWDPNSRVVTQRTVTNTDHDMFCPGTSLDANGRVVVTGGNNAPRTSIYDFARDAWISGPNMQIPRGYQSSVATSDGKIFTIGGGWSGGNSGKNGEVYNPNTNTWSRLPGCPVGPMLTADTAGPENHRQDNHAWLFGWRNGFVFQAGPSKAMNWYNTAGNGGQAAAGRRANDPDAMCGNAVMYDAGAGKILTIGGSPDYKGTLGTTNAHIITLGNPNTNPSVQRAGSMAFGRTYANAVVLPDGKTFVVGGQDRGNPFSDGGAVLIPEMFHPSNNTFTQMASHSIPRTYHSVALLLMDGTVWVGGGGLCSRCNVNHFNAQIYSPPYLFTSTGAPATRPAITTVSASSVAAGATVMITTNSAINRVSLVRYGSTTHTVNTDQRQIALNPTPTGTNTYTFVVPRDTGVVLPGYYMLFVLNSAGVPSTARSLQVRV